MNDSMKPQAENAACHNPAETWLREHLRDTREAMRRILDYPGAREYFGTILYDNIKRARDESDDHVVKGQVDEEADSTPP